MQDLPFYVLGHHDPPTTHPIQHSPATIFLATSATQSSYFLRPCSTAITEPSIFYTRSMVKEYLLRQPSKTALDTMRQPDGQWRCNSMHAMAIVIHHHNIGLNRDESITSLAFTRI